MDEFAEYERREPRVGNASGSGPAGGAGPTGGGGTANHPAVAVRAATSADIDAMARVQEAAGRLAHRDHWERAIVNPECCLVVAEDPETGTVVGWAQTHLHTDPQDAAPAGHYLGGVTVEPGWRRRGVAVALTEARMRWLTGRVDHAFYVVNPANRASIALHRRWRFEEVLRAGTLTGVEFTDGTGILMRAALR